MYVCVCVRVVSERSAAGFKRATLPDQGRKTVFELKGARHSDAHLAFSLSNLVVDDVVNEKRGKC